jgi:hypothetical protein
LGVVVQAERAQLGSNVPASPGTTIFDGDHLTTSMDGVLRVRSGQALMYLGSESGVTLRRTPEGAQALLNHGLLIVSTSRAAAISITADGAMLRPTADVPTIAQVRILGPKELYVVAQRGALEFTYNGESDVIPEGASYRVVLDPPGNMPAAQPGPQRTRRSGKYNRAFLFLIFGVTGIVTLWYIHEAWESPDKP